MSFRSRFLSLRESALPAALLALACIGGWFIAADPRLPVTSDTWGNPSGAVQPAADGSVSQVTKFIGRVARTPSAVHYHDWFNCRKGAKHFTAVAFSVDGEEQGAQMLFELDTKSGVIQSMTDLETGLTITGATLEP